MALKFIDYSMNVIFLKFYFSRKSVTTLAIPTFDALAEIVISIDTGRACPSIFSNIFLSEGARLSVGINMPSRYFKTYGQNE